MTGDPTLADCRAAIDRRLERVLEPASEAGLEPAHAAVAAADDRWYGRLLVRSYEASTAADTDPVVPAAAAVELLRGYCRLRSELLERITDDGARSTAREPTAPLLAGDYLFSAAYSTLGDVDHGSLESCYETMTAVSGTVVESFATAAARPGFDPGEYPSLVDGTAGALGEGAAVIGATLGGVEETRRSQFATLGRGLASARAVHRTLGSDPDALTLAPTKLDERPLKRHAERRLDAADRALRDLSGAVDTNRLRPVVDAVGDVQR